MSDKQPVQTALVPEDDDGDMLSVVPTADSLTAQGKALVPGDAFAIFNLSRNRLRAVIEANMGESGGGLFDLDRIKVPGAAGTTWALPGLSGETAEQKFDAIVVDWRDTRAFWKVGFDQSGGGTPPDCSSDDAILGVGDPGGACRTCPKAVFGSGGGNRQACKLTRLLFIARGQNTLPEVIAVPPGSLRDTRKFFSRLTSNGIPIWAVRVRFELEKTKSTQGIPYARIIMSLPDEAKEGAYLSREQAAKVVGYAEDVQPLIKAARASVEDYIDSAA